MVMLSPSSTNSALPPQTLSVIAVVSGAAPSMVRLLAFQNAQSKYSPAAILIRSPSCAAFAASEGSG